MQESQGQRRRPWNIPLLSFDSIVRKVLSRLIVTDSPAQLPHSPSSGRHAIYLRRSFSTLSPDNRSVMFSEAGKRVGHVCVCFDGKLVVWGGYNDERFTSDSRNFPSNELWVYDPLVEKWSLWRCIAKHGSDDMPPGTSGATSCLIGSDMYIFGGYTTRNENTIYRIDLSPLSASNLIWDQEEDKIVTVEKIRPVNEEDAPIPSDKNVSWSFDGKFFVFGGYGYEPERSDRYRRFMPQEWLFLPDPGSSVSDTQSRRGWNNQLVCFDPATRRWSYPKIIGQWPMARAAHAAAKLGSRVLIFGGRHDRGRVNDLWMLDMNSMKWEEITCHDGSKVPEGRSWHSFTAISDEDVLLYGGLSDSRQPLSDCHVYNLRRNSWSRVSVKTETRLWHSAAFSQKDQQVFIFGGGKSDILDTDSKQSEIYTNDLITMRFRPDSLMRLCLDACSASSHILRPQFEELPQFLERILMMRSFSGQEIGS